ncbi:S24 family peptidase [Flavobacterium sp. TN-1]
MITDRILQIIDYKGISKSKFYKDTGLSNGFLDKVKDIGVSKIEYILKAYPEININWLLLGTGEMLVTKDENFTNKINDSLIVSKNDSKPNMYKNLTNEELTGFVTESKQGIPLLPFDAFAGIGDSSVAGVDFDTIEDRYVVPLFDGIKIDFMIPVRGSSMYPKYNSGDVVACRLVNELLFVQWNKVYVIDTVSQGVIMKRLLKSSEANTVVCKSDNKDYGEFTVPMSDIRSIALVVGVIRLE